MTNSQKVLVNRTLGFSGGLIGCACTAFAHNHTPLKVLGFCGIAGFLGALHILWVQAADRAR